MAWDQRGQKRYYYRSRRIGGKPCCQYLGTGPAGELAATTDELRRLEREIWRRQHKEFQARHHEAQTPLCRLCVLTDILTRASLIAAGFKHHRGEWRWSRGPEVRERDRSQE